MSTAFPLPDCIMIRLEIGAMDGGRRGEGGGGGRGKGENSVGGFSVAIQRDDCVHMDRRSLYGVSVGSMSSLDILALSHSVSVSHLGYPIQHPLNLQQPAVETGFSTM